MYKLKLPKGQYTSGDNKIRLQLIRPIHGTHNEEFSQVAFCPPDLHNPRLHNGTYRKTAGTVPPHYIHPILIRSRNNTIHNTQFPSPTHIQILPEQE